jgi:hypothetical protein
MITHAQIVAESITPALTEQQVMTLSLLVKKYPPYRDASGMWPNFADKLAEEVVTPTVKTQALKAVVTALGKIPAIVVESNGTDQSQSHFSTTDNWWELAELVLNTLYDVPVATGRQSVAVVPVRITDLTLRERTTILPRDTGRRF